MEIISKKQAKDQGLKHYFTGEPCKRGHICERRVGNGTCIECARERAKEWYENNTEKAYENAKKWAKENPEKERERLIKWRQENPERARAQSREWRKNNPERSREIIRNWRNKNSEYFRRWQKENPEKIRSYCATRRARKENAPGVYTQHDINKLMSLQCSKCSECRKNIKSSYHVDHIVPLSKGGSNYPDNLQLLCPHCNRRKQNKTPEEWANQNGRLL